MEETFLAMLEEHECCEDGETTIPWFGTEIILGGCCMDPQEVTDCFDESDVLQILLHADSFIDSQIIVKKGTS